MAFLDELQGLAREARAKAENITAEEATKQALVLPLIKMLGYDIHDTTEVCPEYTTGFGQKKGEKVDYSISVDGHQRLIIECKSANTRLAYENASQLYRYFSSSEARFGILTNGLQYQFFSDIEEPNKMDPRPFMEVSMLGEIISPCRG